MKGQAGFSDEMLNAYLDNELAPDERKRFLEVLRCDNELRGKVARLDQVRNMIKVSYQELEPDADEDVTPRKRYFLRYAAVAAIYVVVGSVIGWYAHNEIQEPATLVQMAEEIHYNKPVSASQPWHILLHVTNNEPHRLNVLLNQTEKILREYQDRPGQVSVRILANGKGLNLLRDDTSPYGKRIEELQREYHNLVFVACAEAIKQVELKTGKKVTLLPHVEVTPSALGEVLSREREGWTYVKI
ncbi:MAG: hypothetical protein GC149_08300 [Gammaproteobacteria bacterium]|nr:hypothetical protein [Gammaproteobacteria bacterium]